MSGVAETRQPTRRRGLAVCALLFAGAAAVAHPAPTGMTLDPSYPVSRYVRDSWGTKEGLPQEMVLSLAQTADGYIWAGTEEGLVRFDGLAFQRFDRETTPAIVHQQVSALLAARDGSLWIGTLGGVTVLRDGVARSFHRKDGYPSEVWALVQRRDGTIWAATSTGVWSWKDGSFRRYGVEHGLPAAVTNALAEDANGTLWAGTAGGLARFDGRRFVRVKDPHVPDHAISAIIPDGNRLWIGTKGSGVALLAGVHSRRFTERDGLGGDYVLTMFRSSRGAIWVGSSGAPMTRIVGDRVEKFGRPEEQHTWAYLEDREGNLWIGGLGLHRLKMPKIHTYTTEDGLSSNTILPIAQDRSGAIWVGTAGGGLNRYRNGRFEQFGPGEGLPGPVVLALLPSRDGTIWISTNRGLARYANGRITPFSPPPGAPTAAVMAFHEDPDGSMWFATNGGGVWSEQAGRLRQYRVSDGLPSDVVYDLHRDSRGVLWFASSGGLARLDGDRVRVVMPELIYEAVNSIDEDADGDLWIATWGNGLVLLRNGRAHAFRERDGLLNDTIHRAIQDRQGTIWITTNRGIASLPKSAFLDFAQRKTKRLRPTRFGRSEGMQSPECNGGINPAGARLADGRLWLPTMEGVAEVDPERIVPNRVPPIVRLESVLLDGEPVDFRGGVRMQAARKRLAIHYNALSLSAPEGLQFRYRLEGFDDEWLDAGNRRSVEYTNLPAGRLRFVVTASNSDGVESTAPASFALEVIPPFTATPLFYLLVAAAVVLAAFGAHRARTRVLRKREQQLVAVLEARTLAAEAIRSSEQHFRSLIENASDIILVLDEEGRVSYASPSVERVLGYAPAALEGRNLLDLAAEDQARDGVRTLLRESRTGPCTSSFRLLRADGSPCSLEATGRRVDEGGRTTIVVNCRDVTERTLLEAQLAQASRVSSLGRLAATIAHEFNNVLMGIQPYAERMNREAEASGPKSVGVDHILRAVKRGKRLTDQILRFTRRTEPSAQHVMASEWIAALKIDLAPLVGPSINVRFRLADPDLGVRIDLAQLNQVLANLVLNARDAMPSGGTIHIEIRPCERDGRFAFGVVDNPERFVHVLVRDSGEGIPPDVLPHIFEPLFTTKKIGGTGLGLAVAHQVVHGHGGQIFVESERGKGSTFHLFLPRSEEQETAAAAEAARTSDNHALRRVLLVEDDQLVAAGLEAILESEGIEVTTVERGGDACDAVERFGPDAVVLDIRLPDIDGVEVYHRIASRWPSLPVVFSTGHGDEARLQPILMQPHVGFLLKPYDAATLVRELNERVS